MNRGSHWKPYSVKFDSLDEYANFECPNDGLIQHTFYYPKLGMRQCAYCCSPVAWIGLKKIPNGEKK